MWTFWKKIYYVLYCLTAKWLPVSRRFKPAKKLRGFWARKILRGMGENVNVEQGACISPALEVGNGSGVGVDCKINGGGGGYRVLGR